MSMPPPALLMVQRHQPLCVNTLWRRAYCGQLVYRRMSSDTHQNVILHRDLPPTPQTHNLKENHDGKGVRAAPAGPSRLLPQAGYAP